MGTKMILYKAYIENFRNIDYTTINFSEFNVLIGENNIGKTNILTAINKVLRKNVYFKEDDFKVLENPIIIELSFNNLSDEDKATFFDFNGIYNPENDEITIKTIVNWRSAIGNTDITSMFIRKDLPESEQEIKEVNKTIRKTLSSIYISAHRNYSKNMDSKGIFELLRLFAPYQTMPLDLLKQEIIQEFRELNELDCEFNLETIENLLDNNEKLTDDILQNLNKIKQESESFSQICNKIENCNTIYIQKNQINDDLLKLNKKHKKYYNLTGIETEMNNIFSTFLNNNDLTFDVMPTEDIELLKNISMDIMGNSILKQGDGYQNYIDLLINLSELIKIKNSNEVDMCNFIVIVEEPETHLHPHMQRNFIKSLKKFKELFEKRNIYLQFFISTHSPYIVSNLKISELNIIRKNENKIISVKLEEDYISQICSEVYSEPKCSSKSIKKINNVINILLNYSDVFFSKEAILCEGDTEFVALPILASKLGYDLDQNGFTLLNMGGAENLKLFVNILKKFKIPTYCILDADKKEKYGHLPNISFIGEDSKHNGAFELEFYKNAPHYKIFKALDLSYPSKSKSLIQEIKDIIPEFDGFDNLDENSEKLFDEYKEDSKYKKIVMKSMTKNKDNHFSRTLAEELDPSEIPAKFKEVFENAIKLNEEKYG